MSERKERCETCRYFEPTGDIGYGGCHRGPRQFVELGTSGHPIFMWPEHFKTDWCGEHKPSDRDSEMMLGDALEVMRRAYPEHVISFVPKVKT